MLSEDRGCVWSLQGRRWKKSLLDDRRFRGEGELSGSVEILRS